MKGEEGRTEWRDKPPIVKSCTSYLLIYIRVTYTHVSAAHVHIYTRVNLHFTHV